MWLSSSPSQVSANRPPFSAVTVRATPRANWATIQSGFFGSTAARVTRYVRGSGPSVGSR